MKTFKQFLIESLTPEQITKYSHVQMTPQARKKTDAFFGEGNDFVKENLKFAKATKKSETHKEVEQHIGQEIDIPNYISGKTSPNERGRQVRLGKIIKDPELLQKFSIDPSRTGGRSDANQGYVTIHRGIQVAGQTNPEKTECNPEGHSWKDSSCKNIRYGGYSHILEPEIQHGTVVMFGHDPSGKEIYRATLQPYHSDSGFHTIYSVNSQYGNKHQAFVNHAHDVAARLSSKTGPKEVVHEIESRVYNDAPTRFAFHPDVPEKILTDAYYADALKGYSERQAALVHHKLPSKVIDEDIQKAFHSPPSGATDSRTVDAPYFKARMRLKMLATNLAPALTKDHISKIISGYAVDQESASPRYIKEAVSALMDHHNFDSSHIRHIINTLPKNDVRYESIRNHAIRHPKIKTKDLVSVMLDPNESYINRSDASYHPKLDKNKASDLIHKERFNPDPLVRQLVTSKSNDHTRHDTLHDMRYDEDPHVRENIARHPNTRSDTLYDMRNDISLIVRRTVAEHPNTHPDILHDMRNDEYKAVSEAATKRLKKLGLI